MGEKSRRSKKNRTNRSTKTLCEEGDIEWALGDADATSDTGYLYDRMIAPLTMEIKGVIWYQGESNSRYAEEYPALMSQLIGGWRKAWDQDRLPFLMMQLVNFDSPPCSWYHPGGFWGIACRPANGGQYCGPTRAWRSALISEFLEIFTSYAKQDVGKRLALIALKQVYGQDVVASGPKLTMGRFQGRKVVLVFDSGGSGQKLVLKDITPKSFELAGAGGQFVSATPEVQQNEIILTAPSVSAPQKVRYAWADNPSVSLVNTAALPAAPFERNKGSE